MHPVLWELDLGRFGHFTLGTYGLFYAAAFLVAVRLSMAYARKEGIDPARMIDLGIWVLLAGIVGAKLLLVITDLPYYWHHKMQLVYSWRSAGVFYGGFIAAVAAGVLYVRRNHLPMGKAADAATPGLVLGQAVGRLGCLSAGCCYGKPTTSSWSMTFVDPRAHDLTGVPLGVPLYPTQIYHGLADLALFFFLIVFYRRKKVDGMVFWTYVLLYGALRFGIEFLRGDYRGEVLGGLLSTSQLISVFAAAAAVFFLFRLAAKHRRA